MYLGLDLTFPGAKPSACAVLGRWGRLRLVCLLTTDAEILQLIERERPALVAMDAPLFYPKGWHCLDWPCPEGACPPPPWSLRTAERDLYREGISLYATTKKSFIKPMIRRAIGLKNRVAPLGFEVIEIYPYASKVRLFGKPIPKKTKPEGREWLRGRLDGLIPGLRECGRLSHDQLDALVAAYTAYLLVQDRAEAVGDPEEGVIVVPAARALLPAE